MPPFRLPGARAGWLLASALVALGVLHLARPAGAPFRRAANDPLTLEDQRGRELERQYDATLKRVMARREVAKALVAGRMDLLEAAARFQALNETMPACGQEALRCYFRAAASDEELACRQVIGWACSLVGNGNACDVLRDRLERQLEEHLRGRTLPRREERSP